MLKFIEGLAREPLFHFLLIGAALFVVFDLRQGNENLAPDRIVIDSERQNRMSARFERTRLRPPTERELKGLIEEQVREEVFYREALAMGLDREDPIVRRRLRMKLEFALDDLSNSEPTDDELREYLARHADRYEIEARLSFRQVFLSADKRDDPGADAARILPRLRQGEDAEYLGDASLLPASLSLATETLIERSFGADFSRALSELEPGDWGGPIYSAFGVHLVRIEERIGARPPALEEVRARVRRDYLAQQREQQKELAYRRLRDKYEVVIEASPQAGNAGGGIVPEAQATER